MMYHLHQDFSKLFSKNTSLINSLNSFNDILKTFSSFCIPLARLAPSAFSLDEWQDAFTHFPFFFFCKTYVPVLPFESTQSCFLIRYGMRDHPDVSISKYAYSLPVSGSLLISNLHMGAPLYLLDKYSTASSSVIPSGANDVPILV